MTSTETRVEGNRAYELKDGIWYLIEDDEHMGQGDPHVILLNALFNMLLDLLRDHPLAHVFQDIYIHWDKTQGSLCLAPDLAVFPRIEPRERRSVYLWEEASRPVFVLEVLSSSTADQDWGDKLIRYRDDLRVAEYFICDPKEGEQKVWGHRLVDGEYRGIIAREDGRVWSEELQAWFGQDEAGMLHVWTRDGRQLRWHVAAVEYAEEVVVERDEAIAERDAQRQRAEEALAQREAQRLRAEAAETRARELEEMVRRFQAAPDRPTE
jgi:Uma2 family endonuclease